ncbi:hypothetical protein [Sulfitobacter sp. SK025]|uniref:hypothetical protein n=1 Tax=Sulfitobacter sp. SK025 TaxID=1389011 RepID=UPI0013B3BD2F|nr:hypothetical protein [Sulfitobacter sp. SK025]
MLKSLIAGMTALFILSGCQDTASVESAPFEKQFLISGNYQATYARALRTMRICLKPGTVFIGGTGAVTLDGQLYNELGYAEIRQGIAAFNPITISLTRIEREGSNTRVSIKAPYGIKSARDTYRNWTEYWMRGGTECQKSAFQNPPPL